MRLSQTYADFNSELAVVLPYATSDKSGVCMFVIIFRVPL